MEITVSSQKKAGRDEARCIEGNGEGLENEYHGIDALYESLYPYAM